MKLKFCILAMLWSVGSASAQQLKPLSGKVTNPNGEPLSNVNIVIKRTGTGVISTADGKFTLKSVSSEDVLSISHIGYQPQTVLIKDKTELNIKLQLTNNELDKVVVQAYGTTSQRLATGNIGRITAADIEKQPIMNPLIALQGQIAGADVVATSGYASGAIKVEIRGRNTLNPLFSSDPLYLIDGVPLTILDLGNNATARKNYDQGSSGAIQSGINSPANGQSPLFNINPADIESIEVLKDADATAIYGSRGANGVVIITTKKGKAGKSTFDMNLYTGYSKVLGRYKMMNTPQYVAMRKEALANDGYPLNINFAPDLVVWDTTRYTDWQDVLWGGMGKDNNVQASLSGGNNFTTFRIGASYHQNIDIASFSGKNNKSSLSFNLGNKSLNQKFQLQLTGNISKSSSILTYLPTAAVALPPNAPSVWNEQGKLNYSGWAPIDYTFPFGVLLQPYQASTFLLNGNISLSYELTKGLNFKMNTGYNLILSKQQYKIPLISQNPLYTSNVGSSQFGGTTIQNILLEPQAEYNQFISKGKATILIGASSQTNTTNSEYLQGGNYKNDALMGSVQNAPIRSATNNSGTYKYIAVFGRINYNWENKYLLNLSARRDGSSRFGPGRRFGNFGSIGAAWILSDESFFSKLLPVISFAKIRASYGTTGGDQIGNYAYLSSWSFANVGLYNGWQTLNPIRHTDSLLQWQVNRKLEFTLSLSFLHDRISLEATWYKNRCNNQLATFPTPIFTGFSEVVSNIPADVQNTGLEYILSASIINKTNFKFSSKFNISFNRNKLLSYPNLDQSPYVGTYVVGRPLNIRRLLKNTGVDPATGLYAFFDKNKDNKTTYDFSAKTADDSYHFDISPQFSGGLTNTFTYKNWNLSILWYFKKTQNYNALVSLDIPGSLSNQPTYALKRWQNPGDETSVAKFSTAPTDASFANFKQRSNGVITDASFIRLQNLSLSYKLPKQLLNRSKIDNISLFVQAQNLFIFTQYEGVDPEIATITTLPKARTITLGLSCNL